MEITTGRNVSNNKGSTSGRNGEGTGGSDPGRGGSGRERISDYSYRSSGVEEAKKLRDRDYSRDGAGAGSGRGRDRDSDRKEWGASRGSDPQAKRWRGSSDSGRSGSNRHYEGGGDGRDRGHRYHSHHRRDRSSRSPLPSDRSKRPRVSGGSPGNGISGGGGGSGGILRDARESDRDRSRAFRDRDRDRGARLGSLVGGGVGKGKSSGTRSSSEQRYRGNGSRRSESGGRSSARNGDGPMTVIGVGVTSGSRRLPGLPEDSVANGGGNSGSRRRSSSSSGSGGGRSTGRDSTPRSGSRSGSSSADDATVRKPRRGAALEVVNGSNGRFLMYSPVGGGEGRGGGAGDRKPYSVVAGADAEEEGEVLLSASSVSASSVSASVSVSAPLAVPSGTLRSPSRRTNGYSGSGGVRGRGDNGADVVNDDRGNEYPSRHRFVPAASPKVRRRGVEEEGGGGASADRGGVESERPKKAGKDRWADSESDDDDDDDKEDEKEGNRNSSASRNGNGISGVGKANVEGHGLGGARLRDARGKKSNAEFGEGGVIAGGAGGREPRADDSLAEGVLEGGAPLASEAKDLYQAMMAGVKTLGGYSRYNGAGERRVARAAWRTPPAESSSAQGSSAHAPPMELEEVAVGSKVTSAVAVGSKRPLAVLMEDQNDVGGKESAAELPLPPPLTVFTRDQTEEDPYNPLLNGSRSVDNFERIRFIDEGAYGKVYCALNKSTGQVVALKQVKLSRDMVRDGFPITALRETNVLLSLHHPNIVRVLEMVVGSTLDKVYMVMEYFDHDLKSVMHHLRKEKRCFTVGQIKSLVQQLLRAVEYMHRHWYIHRDLKTSNLLYNHQGKLAVCDFGLSRKYEDPIRTYTLNVVTQWYRCPELLMGATKYNTGVDTWSVGCIFGEMVKGAPMFQGKTEIDQLSKIFGVLGSPTEMRWPGWSKLPVAKKLDWRQGKDNQLSATFPTTGFSGNPPMSPNGIDLLDRLLSLDPSRRISAAEALNHEWLREKPEPTPVMPQVNSILDAPIDEALAKWETRKRTARSPLGPRPRLA